MRKFLFPQLEIQVCSFKKGVTRPASGVLLDHPCGNCEDEEDFFTVVGSACQAATNFWAKRRGKAAFAAAAALKKWKRKRGDRTKNASVLPCGEGHLFPTFSFSVGFFLGRVSPTCSSGKVDENIFCLLFVEYYQRTFFPHKSVCVSSVPASAKGAAGEKSKFPVGMKK